MPRYYYLGKINNELNQFNKMISHEKWNHLKNKIHSRINEYNVVKYYSLDRIFTLNKKTGKTITEKPTIVSTNTKDTYDYIAIDNEEKELPFFPTQWSYFNKQVIKITEYNLNDGIIYFTEVTEKGNTFYEIYSNSLKALFNCAEIN
jgi:hypothetical protein